eukprot:1160428-Pelagomonas_calceolata.AAC.16
MQEVLEASKGNKVMHTTTACCCTRGSYMGETQFWRVQEWRTALAATAHAPSLKQQAHAHTGTPDSPCSGPAHQK